jgi:predicted RNase H-like HicB family nuclease
LTNSFVIVAGGAVLSTKEFVILPVSPRRAAECDSELTPQLKSGVVFRPNEAPIARMVPLGLKTTSDPVAWQVANGRRFTVSVDRRQKVHWMCRQQFSPVGKSSMLVYKSAYKWENDVCLGEVLDFPGTVSFGRSLDEARENLAAALRDMAETNLLRGEPLPIPDAGRSDADADLEEPIYLILQTGQRISQQIAAPTT